MKLRVAIALAITLLSAAPASAQDLVSGAVQGHFVASIDEELGGAISSDLWYGVDVFRFGGFIGVGAIPTSTLR